VSVAAGPDEGMQTMQPKAHKTWKSKVMGRHKMKGSVTDVDHDSGFIKVKTEEGEMTIHFPPKSIEHLKTGDEIVVYLGYSMAGKEKMKGEMGMKPKKEEGY
ncbi:MAG TPA: hypothetical protein PLK99_07155, partial [Burkholderiales bacterium]|nr:hypothetical protein [Burkholderiales bacterium]